jgi:hypothetical protein
MVSLHGTGVEKCLQILDAVADKPANADESRASSL